MGEQQENYCIIVAGGSGNRMNAPVPKQFLKLNEKPILLHTIEKFLSCGLPLHIILVLPDACLELWRRICDENNFNHPIQIAPNGESRYQSVKNGLRFVKGDGIVAVHDAVRPLVNKKTIVTAFKSAEMYGNAVPAIPLSDSIRQIDSTRSIAMDRSKFCIVQTPQCFKVNILRKAYEQGYNFTFTDDATVVEATGEKIHLIDGNPENIKITTPSDMVIAEALMLKAPEPLKTQEARKLQN